MFEVLDGQLALERLFVPCKMGMGIILAGTLTTPFLYDLEELSHMLSMVSKSMKETEYMA